MRSAPAGAGQAWTAIIASVAGAFTRPSFRVFADLMAGWVLTPGRRTITRIIGVVDPEGRRSHDAYHRCDTKSHTTSEYTQIGGRRDVESVAPDQCSVVCPRPDVRRR